VRQHNQQAGTSQERRLFYRQSLFPLPATFNMRHYPSALHAARQAEGLQSPLIDIGIGN